jgi:hypothetical protein
MYICNSLATALSLKISNLAITLLMQISSFFELTSFLSSCQKSQHGAQVASFQWFSPYRASKFDDAGKTDEAGDSDPVNGKATSKTPKTTKRFSGSGQKRTQNPLSRFYPSLPEAGVGNHPVVHQKKDIGSDLEPLTPMNSKYRRTLLEQIELHQEEFELCSYPK